MRQVRSQTIARRMLSVWHTVHIPLGMALFILAFVHIGAALYYSTLLR
jgi:cytochrome b561